MVYLEERVAVSVDERSAIITALADAISTLMRELLNYLRSEIRGPSIRARHFSFLSPVFGRLLSRFEKSEFRSTIELYLIDFEGRTTGRNQSKADRIANRAILIG